MRKLYTMSLSLLCGYHSEACVYGKPVYIFGYTLRGVLSCPLGAMIGVSAGHYIYIIQYDEFTGTSQGELSIVV
jgi:hypothetical protein